MAASVVAVGNSAGQSAGTTTTASTVSVTPTLPTGSASGDRVFILVSASNTAGTTPTSWTALYKDVQCGPTGTAPGASVGKRYLSCYYRDYDGSWSMPAVTLTSATQNTQAVASIALRKGSADTWDTPTASGAANTSSAVTSYSVTSGTFTTVANAVLMAHVGTNDNVTSTSQAITGTNGFTSGTVTERVDGGSATGNDASIKLYTCIPSAADSPAGALTNTATLSAASEGGTVFVQQTVTYTPPDHPIFEAVSTVSTGAGSVSTTCSIPPPSGVAANDIVLAFFWCNSTTATVTPPTGFTAAPHSPVSASTIANVHVFWKRATGADSTNYDFALSSSVYNKGYSARWSSAITSGNPLDTDASAGASSGTTTALVSMTTSGANRTAVWLSWGNNTVASITMPSGFTKRFDDFNTNDNPFVFGDKQIASAGATGAITGTWNADTGQQAAWLGALLPVPTTTTAPDKPVAVPWVPVMRASFY